MFVDQHEAARVAQARDCGDGVDAFERGDYGAEGKGQFVLFLERSALIEFLNRHLVRAHGCHLGVGNPFDMPLTKLGFHQTFAIADPA